jgi:hypothetical protein
MNETQFRTLVSDLMSGSEGIERGYYKAAELAAKFTPDDAPDFNPYVVMRSVRKEIEHEKHERIRMRGKKGAYDTLAGILTNNINRGLK